MSQGGLGTLRRFRKFGAAISPLRDRLKPAAYRPLAKAERSGTHQSSDGDSVQRFRRRRKRSVPIKQRGDGPSRFLSATPAGRVPRLVHSPTPTGKSARKER